MGRPCEADNSHSLFDDWSYQLTDQKNVPIDDTAAKSQVLLRFCGGGFINHLNNDSLLIGTNGSLNR